MHYELYVDRVFLVQLIMNLLLLILTAAVARLRVIRGRLVWAAAAGSLFFLVILLWPLGDGLWAAAAKALLQTAGTLFMLQMAFGFTGPGACLRAGTVYGICACLMGGFMTLFGRERAESWWQVLPVSALLTAFGAAWARREGRRSRRKTYTVRLREGDRCLQVEALLDSGNSLVDPLSGAPVCIVHKSVIEGLGLEDRPERFRAIPYHSIGREHGLLYAWAVEKMEIRSEGQNLECQQVLLARSEGQLSLSEGYQMILHPAILEEEKGENHDFKSCDAGKDAV